MKKNRLPFVKRQGILLAIMYMCLFAGRAFSQCDNEFQFSMNSTINNNYALSVKLLSGTVRGTTVTFPSPATGGSQTLSGIGATVSGTAPGGGGNWLCTNNTPFTIDVTQDNGCKFSFLYSNYQSSGQDGPAVLTTVKMPSNNSSTDGYMTFTVPAGVDRVIDNDPSNNVNPCPGSSTGPWPALTISKTGLGSATYTNYAHANTSFWFGAVFNSTQLPAACIAPSAVTVAGTQTYCQNATATALTSSFSGTATGATYEWYAGGTIISGATSGTYTPPTTTVGTVNYTVKVTNSCGNATSANYPVTVNASLSIPVITKVDPTCTVSTGSINVTSPVSGITYTLAPGGATSTTGSFTGLTAGSGPYTVTASNGACTSGVSNSISIAAAPNCSVADLRPVGVMSDIGFIKPSALTKNATLRIFNVGPTTSVSSGLITVYVYPPDNHFSVALGSAPGWAMAYNAGGNYYTLTSFAPVAYGASNYQSVPLVITAAPATSKGKYTISFEIADGSGGETNTLNNTAGIEMTVSGL